MNRMHPEQEARKRLMDMWLTATKAYLASWGPSEYDYSYDQHVMRVLDVLKDESMAVLVQDDQT